VDLEDHEPPPIPIRGSKSAPCLNFGFRSGEPTLLKLADRVLKMEGQLVVDLAFGADTPLAV
jgi:hypothetical protein